jgi:hypothetical protein
MKRRLIIGAAAVLVAGLVVVGVTVGVNVKNGDYGQAGTIITSALKANGAVSTEAARLRKLPGVAKVAQAFSPLHLPDPAATLTVTMKSSSSSTEVLAVAGSVSTAWARDHMKSDLLTLMVKARSLTVQESKFGPTSTLAQQLAVWTALLSHTHVGIVGRITDAPSDSSQALTITTASGTPEAARSLAKSYGIAFDSPVGMAAGPSWKLPGINGTGSLPPHAVLALFSANARHLPVAEQNGQHFTSGVSLRWDGSSKPYAHLYLAYLSSAGHFAATAAHASEASNVAKSVIASGISGLNFAYEAYNNGAIVQYDFYTGVCHGRAIPTTEKTDDLSLLGLTVTQLNGGQPGQCLPPA